ncbi:hypothetical protein TL16_g03165 [Triparma laevis f. inornata]|uniref:Uncharacterized protein n=1 Tax=Triparma laevis f. inornata TaxID=1714386 RepID=A0A9W7E0N2_9STRA|nr:hypothetical protein TL16_g03165 [Triparma laevis f. inornata]
MLLATRPSQQAKHYWGENTWGYETAVSTLEYLSEYDCQPFSYSIKDNSTLVYGGLQPLEGGLVQMSVYTDKYCLEVTGNHGDYDDYWSYEGSGDGAERR